MAQKKTYIYRMLIGHKDTILVDVFLYARNADIATAFCKEKYKEKKYDYYKAIKVGISHYLRETGIVDDYTANKLKDSIAAKEEKFSERDVELPTFIKAEETGEE